MKIKVNVCCLLATVVAAGFIVGCASESGEHESDEHEHHQAAAPKAAKLTEADARAIVMAKLPDAQIKEGELEKENGKMIWSFDLAKGNSEGVVEINVDAVTGDIVAMEKKDKD
jgi:uncharacterized membrane protein YkoI